MLSWSERTISIPGYRSHTRLVSTEAKLTEHRATSSNVNAPWVAMFADAILPIAVDMKPKDLDSAKKDVVGGLDVKDGR